MHFILCYKGKNDVINSTRTQARLSFTCTTTTRRPVSTCWRALWHDASPFPSLMKTCRWKMVYLGLYITYQWKLPWEDKNENLKWPCGNVHGVRKTDRIVKTFPRMKQPFQTLLHGLVLYMTPPQLIQPLTSRRTCLITADTFVGLHMNI